MTSRQSVNTESASRIFAYLAANNTPSPCLVVDLNGVRSQYRALVNALPEATCHYAVKSNPAQAILKTLVALGSSFDIASPAELQMCLEAGAKPEQILYSNTIKKPSEIAAAYNAGVRIFAVDSIGELQKLATHAPGAQVLCRIKTDGVGAAWPLSRKFGCDPEDAIELLVQAPQLGLEAYGVSFHVGSQMLQLTPWDSALARAADVFAATEARGVKLKAVNLGGGFPAHYREEIPGINAYGEAIRAALHKHFGENLPHVIAEPGRYMAADAGVLQSEVVLVSQNHKDDPRRWVYLDVGKFTGLTEAEAIEYPILSSKDGDPTSPVVIAGPTCDSVDVIYENAPYELPVTLEAGDMVWLMTTGAYTTTYSTVGFNGFAPLAEVYLPLTEETATPPARVAALAD